MKKHLLLLILLVTGLSVASAAEPVKGIIATYDGADTSYKLEDMPTIKYENVGGVQHAVLYLKDKAEPVLSVALANGKQLVVVYGEYVPSGIDRVTIAVRNGKKVINGGKLIIVSKDGKMYDAAGKLIER